MSPNRLSQLLLCCSVLFLLILAGCESRIEKEQETPSEKKQTVSQSVQGGIYRVPLLNNPPTLDPAYVQDQYGTAVVQQIFDGLVRFDPYLQILPALAMTWQIEENGTKYRFVLHENATFHNGQPVTAEDVVFSLSRLLRIDPSPAILPHLLKIVGARTYKAKKNEIVAGLQIVDNRTVLIQLEEPHTPFLTALGMYQAKIVPKTEVIRSGDSFGRNPVGSGPFRFVSWEADKRIQLQQFTNYFAGPAFLDGVEYTIYPGLEINLVISDFRHGKLEEMPVFGDMRKDLADQGQLQWFHRPALCLMFYGIKADWPLLDNPEFRRALSSAIDRENLNAQAYNRQFEPARHILPPGMPGLTKEGENQIGDLATAQNNIERILKEKKLHRFSVEIVSGSKSAFAQAELNFVREAWAHLGIDLEIKYISDWPEFETYIKSDAVQMYRYAWFADMPDPDSFLYPLFASDSPANLFGYEDENVDQMLLAARGESDSAKRNAIYREIEAIIMESSPLIPLIYPSVDRVYRSNVQGAQPSALGAHYMPLNRVWFKRDASIQ